MIEHKLIKCALLNREAFNKIKDILNRNELSSYGESIFKLITNYYESDIKAESIDIELLEAVIDRRYPKQREEFTAYLSNLPEEVSIVNILKYIAEQQKEVLGNKMAAMLIEDISNPKISTIMSDYLALDVEVEEQKTSYSMEDIYDLLNREDFEQLVPLYPSIINSKVGGGVPRQSQILVFGRPDSGKTTVTMNIAGGAVQAGYNVLYFGNEDSTRRMILRFLTRMTGMTIGEIEADSGEALERARKGVDGVFNFKELHPGTLGEIRTEIMKYAPDIVIVDQVRAILVNKDNSTRNLEEAGKGMRALAKEFNFVSILVTQAGDSATGKLYLKMEDVDSSNTGLQGALDLMIGVGQTQELKEQNTIMLSFPKNKLSEPIKPFSCKINYPLNTVMGRKQ